MVPHPFFVMSNATSGPVDNDNAHYVSPKVMTIVITIFLSLATVAVCLRFFARHLSRSRYCADDWLVLAALILSGGFVGSIIYCLTNIQTTRARLTGAPFLLSQELVYATEILYYLIQSCLKFSVLTFYWRLFKSTYLRYWIYWMGPIVSLWSLAAIITAAAQCLPLKASWEMDPNYPFKCINLQAFFLGISIPHIILDTILIVMPIPHIWGLMLPISKKIPVLTLFLLSASILVASSTRLYYVIHFDSETFRYFWATDRSVLWSTLEHCLGIIGISMPSMRPIFRFVSNYVKSISGTEMASASDEHPPAIQRPRMGSVEYWMRLHFQSLSLRSSRRPSHVPEMGIEENPPRRPSTLHSISRVEAREPK